MTDFPSSKDGDHSPQSEQLNGDFHLSEEDTLPLNQIFQILQSHSAVDFSQYRRTTVWRRITRRMGLQRINSLSEYKEVVEKDGTERKALYNDLLLSFTHFFRDANVFDTLKEKVFPHLIENRTAKSPIRIWVPGCSTGEEVYSLAIALYEYLGKTGAAATAQFFGTDLMEENIAQARSGLYGEKISEHVSPERLNRFFDAEPGHFRVTKTIREMCVFATQDITRDPPFPNIDMISCRNVLIYFNDAFQDIVFPVFHFALKHSGYLVLGSSETISRLPQLFSPYDSGANIYKKQSSNSPTVRRLPFYHPTDKTKPLSMTIPASQTVKDSYEDAQKQMNATLVKEFSPPGVLVDSNLIIRQFIGQPFPFIGPSTGEASLKLAKMANDGILPDLYVAIEECKRSQERITKTNIQLTIDDSIVTANITVIPFNEGNQLTSFLILFSHNEPEMQKTPGTQNGDIPEDDSLQKLKQELRITKNHLQAIIEEKDEVNLELWAANEEVQSTNEELQSVNEEMEAAKEELESSNEELMALNEELHQKNIILSEREQQLRELFDNMTDGFASHRIIYDDKDNAVDYEFVEVNEEFARRIGMSRDAIIGKTARNLFPQTEQYWIERFERVARTQRPDNFTNYSKELDKHYQARLYSPKLGYCAAVFADVTDQIQAEQALRNSEKKFKSYIDSSPHGIFIADENGRYIEVNNAACRITGFPRNELLGMPLANLIHPEDLTRATEHFEMTRIEGEASEEFRFFNKEGQLRYWQVDAVKLSETRYLGIAGDTTQSHLLQEEIQQSEKMRAVGQLAGGIAHDFNNQLSGILGFADLLVDEVQECATATKYVENIITSVKRAANLTSQLLAFSRKGKYLNVPVDIHSVLTEACSLLSHSIDKRIELKKNFCAAPPFVTGDPTQLQNAFLNVALNARDAMPDGGELVFETKSICLDAAYCAALTNPVTPGNYIETKISDTGTGITEDVKSHIFEPFFTTKSQGKGVGMGLSATYGTIKNHGGTISFDSSTGDGTVFKIYLPAEHQTKMVQKEEVAADPLEPGAHILFVDDDETICALAETVLGSLGYAVTIEKDGAAALRYYKKEWNTIDLVILDMVMPVMGGKDTFLAMKKINPDIIVLISSGYSIKGEAQELVNLGAADFIQKPFRKKELGAKLHHFLQQKKTSHHK